MIILIVLQFLRDMIIKNLFIAISILILLTGCRNSPAPSGQRIEVPSGFEDMDEVRSIYYRFPSPGEMLNFIDKEELDFSVEYLHPVEKSTSYLDSRSQALNLGVYIADMAYITLFQRQKEALTYFQVIYGLSDQLRISGAFDLELMKRFDDNLKIADSLKVIADEAMTDIVNYLVSNNKEKVFSIVSIGGFIESLYVAFNIAGEYSEKNPVIQRISDQKLVLDNLLGYCSEFEDDGNVSEAVQVLNEIKVTYDQLTITLEETSLRKTADGNLILEGGNIISMSEGQYAKLKETLFKARWKITENREN